MSSFVIGEPKAWECRLYGHSCGEGDCGVALFIDGTTRAVS
jgi:hypothetical protein